MTLSCKKHNDLRHCGGVDFDLTVQEEVKLLRYAFTQIHLNHFLSRSYSDGEGKCFDLNGKLLLCQI